MTFQGNESQVRVDSLATLLLSNGGRLDALQNIDLLFQLQRLISDRRSTHTKPKGYQILDFLKLDWMLDLSDPLRIPFVRYKTVCKTTDLFY